MCIRDRVRAQQSNVVVRNKIVYFRWVWVSVHNNKGIFSVLTIRVMSKYLFVSICFFLQFRTSWKTFVHVKYETDDCLTFVNLLFIKTHASFCRHRSESAFIGASALTSSWFSLFFVPLLRSFISYMKWKLHVYVKRTESWTPSKSLKFVEHTQT